MSITILPTQRMSHASASILQIAHDVLEKESHAIQSLIHRLGEPFTEVVQRLLSTKGKVILSGVGKSGHIAQKIASTFASTGTPAFFLHPTEANHGDLGLLEKEDALILLSNSGETQELFPLVAYAKQLRICCILFTSNPESSLAKTSQLVLSLPPLPEACPMGLAPTTSTAMMLALGDALAVTLLKLKKFESEDYRERHPGGALGKKLYYVKEIARPLEALPSLSFKTTLQDALFQMACYKLDGVVVESSYLLMAKDIPHPLSPQMLLKDLPLKPFLSVLFHTFVKDALTFMLENNVCLLKVIDTEGKAIGFVHQQDCET